MTFGILNQGCESHEGNVEAVLRVLFRNPEKDLPVFLLRQVGYCTMFLTFHNITYNAVKQILIVYKFFMSLNESVKETNIFFTLSGHFAKYF